MDTEEVSRHQGACGCSARALSTSGIEAAWVTPRHTMGPVDCTTANGFSEITQPSISNWFLHGTSGSRMRSRHIRA